MTHLILLLIYFAFVSLGLPDALLGSAWPVMTEEFQTPVSYMGIVSLLISGTTVVSSLLADRANNRFGTGKVTAISVTFTAVAMFGFAVSTRFWHLCLWAIPYGLGAGCVDASLNNYVANHYASRHMSWLHCMWGVGAAIGPYVMGAVLTAGQAWNMGYVYVGIFQIVLTAVLLFTIPKWKAVAADTAEAYTPLSLKEIFAIPGIKAVALVFLCYAAVESIAGHWASSYLVLHLGTGAEQAAGLAAFYYLGITIGRAISGFITLRVADKQLARWGMAISFAGLATILLSKAVLLTMIGFVVAGVGCAPIFPCIIHATPERVGKHRSQAVIGVQMASFYFGTCLLPPAFGVLADIVGIGCFPVVLLSFLGLMIVFHRQFYRLTEQKATKQL